MKLSELKAGQGKVDVLVEVKSKGEVRTFNKYGKDLRVSNAVVSDGESEIKFSLWNDDIDKVNVGNKLKITNGYVSEFNGEKQLSAGKFGKMEVISGEAGEEKAKPAKKAKKSEVEEVAF